MTYWADNTPHITADAALRHLADRSTDATQRWLLEQLAERCASLATETDSLRRALAPFEQLVTEFAASPHEGATGVRNRILGIRRESESRLTALHDARARLAELETQLAAIAPAAEEPPTTDSEVPS